MPKPRRSPGHAVPPHPKPRKNHCFACGKDNPKGMRLKFYLDEEARRSVCEFKLSRQFQGPPGHAHGGIIAAILDEAMGKVNKLHKVVALTRKMEVDYLKPVPLGQKLTVIGREQQTEGRRHINVAEITNAKGELLARSTGIFVAVDVHRVFERNV